jgi:hypothetical protein
MKLANETPSSEPYRKMHRVYMESFNLKKLNKVEGKEQYHVEISNRFAAF